MSQANRESTHQLSRVHADVPGLTRRVALTLAAGTVAASAATVLAATKALAAAVPDPIFAAIEAHRAAHARLEALCEGPDDPDIEPFREADDLAWELAETPTTLTGLAALARYGIELEERGDEWPDYGGGDSWWAAVARRVTELAVAS